MDIKRIYDWNKSVGNKPGNVDKNLEIAMLEEEFNEFKTALIGDDLIETVDGAIDMVYVAIGTLMKLGVSRDVVEKCFDEICDSNDSKLPFNKDENGKVTKGDSYFKPNLKQFLN